nr:reverse transcriptase domain-containing protein [Tanacetum cinerariifolium]
MKELLQAPTEGYGEAIVILKILAENFEIKTNLLQLVQTNKFHGFERDNPHTHIFNFKRMASTLKYRDVPNDAIKLRLFPYFLAGAARIWYEKEPPNSILTWDDLVNKFINKFFPPSKTTHLKNDISCFTQRFEETFGAAWERFKEMLRACLHHGFSELTQIDTFYNGLNEQDQDSLNAMAGGIFLSKMTREALKIIENKSKVCYSRSKSNVSRVNTNSKDNSIEIVNKQVITPATAKAVEKTCVIYGGAHAYYDCIATDSNQPSVCAATGTYNQVSPPNQASNQIPPPGFVLVQNNLNRNMQNQINVLRGDFNKQQKNLRRNLNNDMRSSLGSFFQNQASTSGTLPSNNVPNPKGEMKAITTRSGLAYDGPPIPTHSPLEKPDVPRTQPKPNIPYPSRLNDQKLHEKATNQMEKFFQIFHDLHFDIRFADALLLMPKFASTIKSLLTNKDKLFELAKVPLNENCSAMLLKKLPEKLGDPDFKANPRVPLILGRSFLRIDRALIDVYGEEITLMGEILYLEKLLNDDPFQLPPIDLKQAEETKSKYSIEEPPELELKELPSHLEYAFLEDTDKLPKISDIKGIDPRFCTHKILMEEDYKPVVQSQRRVNPKIHDVIKKEVIKLLDAEMIYPISDSPWVSPIHCVPKKGGMTVVANENNKLIPTRLVTSWRVCIDYRKLNDATRKDHFPLPFMDQMLERLDGNEFYCFLDGFLGYFQISIDPQDQEKTTFTCPYGTFAYRCMPFGLCSAPAGSENCPPMLNKENYVPWSSRLLRYAKSRPNEKLIHNSILNDDELSDKELKQIEADDQAIQTILLGLPEDIYAAVDSCETAQEIWLRVQQMMKGSDIGIQEKTAKLFNEWERFTSNEGESIESYYHRFLKLMNDLKRNKHFPEKIASNLKFLNNLQPEWSRHVTIVHQTKDLHTADSTQLYDFLKYNQKEFSFLENLLQVQMDDPNITMEEYIRLEEEKARRR